MKLSEAIRLGAMMKPQGFGSVMGRDETTACALEAALLAAGIAPRENDGGVTVMAYNALDRQWPHSLSLCKHPVNGRDNELFENIYSLNDHYHWTREAISAWVATIEPQEEEHDGRAVVAADGAAGSYRGEHDQAGEAQERPQAYRDAGAVAGAIAG